MKQFNYFVSIVNNFFANFFSHITTIFIQLEYLVFRQIHTIIAAVC